MTTIKKIHVVCSHSIFIDGDVEFPEGKTLDDIDTCFVKYGSFRCTFKDGTEFEQDLGDASFESVDWKYPSTTKVYAVGEDGWPIRGFDLSEQIGCE